MVIDPYPRDLQPTIYSDPRTIYSQPTNQYVPTEPPPRPTVPPGVQSDATAPPVGTVPSSSNAYHRQQAQQLATRVTGSNTPAFRPSMTRGAAVDVQVGNVVYQSLQRPKLLRGGEWQLSMVTNLIAAAFVILAIMQWNWRMLPGALFFGGPIQWLLRRLAEHDPKYWQKWQRTIGQPLIHLAHGKPGDGAPEPQILPKPSLFVH